VNTITTMIGNNKGSKVVENLMRGGIHSLYDIAMD
jgi:hypothetical protein